MPQASSQTRSAFNSHLTLVLCTVLHAFTHAYMSVLVPLYLLMSRDLGFNGVKGISLIVSLYILIYFASGYASGILADRFNRKRLLTLGLIGNAVCVGLMGLTGSYPVLLGLGVLAGLFGSLFHPAAQALIPAHYPNRPGMAIGLLGIGTGVGFYFGPRFAGWRAETGGGLWSGLVNWQIPLVEIGIIGVVFGILFGLLAREVPHRRQNNQPHQPLGSSMRWRVIVLSLVLGCRDFSATALFSLASIYMQKGLGFDVSHAGGVLGTMMLVGIVLNPLLVLLTEGRWRLSGLSAILVAGGIFVVFVPFVPANWAIVVFMAYQSMQLPSYAVSDAALMERVPAQLRGRVMGLFLTIAGTMGALGPWAMGFWTDRMGLLAGSQSSYIAPFALLGITMVIAAFSTPLIGRLGPVTGSHHHHGAEEGLSAMAND